MEPTVQNDELAAYVVGAVQLFKPVLKSKVPVEYHALVFVALSAAFGALFNVAMYGYSLELLSTGAFVGATASGAFATVKEVLEKGKKKK